MTSGTPTQTETLRDSLPAPQTEDPDKPRMPFRTSYVLTREQEDALVEFATQRSDQLSDQMGRKVREGGTTKGHSGLTQTLADPNTFLGKRERYTLHFYNHVDYRAKTGTVYEQSNLTLSLSQRIAMQMIASATTFFFGQPDDIDWFSSNAVGAEDETLSDKVKKHSRWKIDQCGVKHRLIEALEAAFIRGEAVVKVTHQERSQIYKRTATILMGDDGEPTLDANGDFICQGDTFVDEMGPAPAPEQPGVLDRIKNFVGLGDDSRAGGPQPGGAPEDAQQPQMVPTGNKVLKRDGTTVLPAEPNWHEQVITRRLVTFEGPDAQVIHYKDFIYPLEATDLQSADMIAHLYDMDVMHIAQMFRGQYGEGDQAIADISAAVERLRAMLNESNEPKTAASQPQADMKETDTAGPQGQARPEIAECYLTYDADGDGILEEIMLVLDRRNKAPIYYEYLANVTVRGLRPVFEIRPMGVDGRCYGMGAMELFDPEQEFIDLQVNRHNFRTSEAGMVKFWNPAATVEGNRDPNLRLNMGKTYTKRDANMEAKKILEVVELPTDAKALEYLIDLFMQAMQLKSGKINPGDQKMSGLPSSETATGENLIMQSGDELFARILANLFPGVKAALAAVVDVIYANMNRAEVFNYFNGEADEILTLDPDEVRDMALNVTLELSRTQQRKVLEMGDRSDAIITWFYQLPFALQQRAVTYARQRLKALGVSQADKIIDPIDTGGPASKVSESINYKDARPGIKAQIEEQAGMDPNRQAPAGMEAGTEDQSGTQESRKTAPSAESAV